MEVLVKILADKGMIRPGTSLSDCTLYDLESGDFGEYTPIRSLPGVAIYNPIHYGYKHLDHHGPGDGRALTVPEFVRRFYAAVPALRGIHLPTLGMVAAGGSCYLTISRNNKFCLSTNADVDLFLVGHESDATVFSAIRMLYMQLRKQWSNIKIVRTTRAVTFCNNSGEDLCTKIQVIMRRFNTVADVLNTFDIGACSIAFNGENVQMSLPGLIAVKFNLIAPNLNFRTHAYEGRIGKYMVRGLSLAMPGQTEPRKFLGLPSKEKTLWLSYSEKDEYSVAIRYTRLSAYEPESVNRLNSTSIEYFNSIVGSKSPNDWVAQVENPGDVSPAEIQIDLYIHARAILVGLITGEYDSAATREYFHKLLGRDRITALWMGKGSVELSLHEATAELEAKYRIPTGTSDDIFQDCIQVMSYADWAGSSAAAK